MYNTVCVISPSVINSNRWPTCFCFGLHPCTLCPFPLIGSGWERGEGGWLMTFIALGRGNYFITINNSFFSYVRRARRLFHHRWNRRSL